MGTSYLEDHDIFNWLHINTYRGLTRVGAFLSFFIRLCFPASCKRFHDEYKEYLSKTDIQYDKRDYYAVVACILIYGVSVKEYFLYDFAALNDKGRREYITEKNRYRIYPYFNGAKRRDEMQDKYKAYITYKQYYKRDAILINGKTTTKDLQYFFTERESAILKPNRSALGKGVEIFRMSGFGSKDAAFEYLLTKQDYIMEELVHQTGLLRDLHPQSVNTVRVYACRLRTGIKIFGCHLRAGIGDSVVDNAGQGGVIISIDLDGIAWRSGMDEFGHDYVTHPDTGVFIPGLRLPEWDQAKQLVTDAMQIQQDIRYVGWDLAYTDRGWIIIEANDNGQFHGYQIPYHYGARKQLLDYVRQL